MNERELIHQLESAGPKELIGILSRPGPDEERTLRTHLGDARYERMRALVLQGGLTRTLRAPQGNVIVLHGIMGGELSYFATDTAQDQIWLRVFRIVTGQFGRFAMDDQGGSVSRVQATGILKRYYGELILSLMQNWQVQAFWYDWRLDVNDSAKLLRDRIEEWFPGQPVHLVAHSMGGLVARAFIRQNPERWQSMWDAGSNGSRGGRLVMLGTPNHGSFAIPQLLMGLNDTIKKVALLDLRHSLQDLLNITKSFVGTYQMLPSALALGDAQKFYEASTYAPLAVLPGRLSLARAFHESLRSVIDPDRMVYVAGYNKPTYCGIKNWAQLRSMDGYEVTRRGDGTVPHQLGLLQTADGHPVPTFYIEEEHGALPGNQKVIAALDQILQTGTTAALSQQIPSAIRGGEDDSERQAAKAELLTRTQLEEARVRELALPLQTVTRARGGQEEPPVISDAERQLEELVARDFVAAPSSDAVQSPPGVDTPTDNAGTTPSTNGVPPDPETASLQIRIRLLHTSIDQAGQNEAEGEVPVDAIAVGHYIGVKPVAAERALDEAISTALPGKVGDNGANASAADLVLTQFTERGIIRGELGQPFYLDDPRILSTADSKVDRLVAIIGMGYAGRFGVPELTVMARELCWSLGRLGKRHLATVLIGSGQGNLSVRDAIGGWLEGIRRALHASADDAQRHLAMVTFVENRAGRVLRLWNALVAEVARRKKELNIDLVPWSTEELEALRAKAREEDEQERRAAQEREQREDQEDESQSEIPSRMTVELDQDEYRFGAITEGASIPERSIVLDPDLIREANDDLAAQRKLERQGDLGEFLQKVLMPAELAQLLASNRPLVLVCDAATARIHWEMVAQPVLPAAVATPASSRTFLGIHRGFTRQLKTRFAPPPEPPPPPSRVLRVLIVGDPADDDPLPGAQEEALLVRDLFYKLAQQQEGKRVSKVEVCALIGPSEATRSRVMQELILRAYDVMHYAGHCMYDPQKPSASGWIFTGGKRLSANELSRVDQVPKFVFSNACESGITPDRSEKRAAELAPSFAEAFFARGVQNFVCTGWPVNDQAARDFAQRFYSGLLGLDDAPPEPMHVAMREARLGIFNTIYGLRTWGAYQHYGNPYFRLFR